VEEIILHRKTLVIGIILLFSLTVFCSLTVGNSQWEQTIISLSQPSCPKELSFSSNDTINISVFNIPEDVMVNESGDCWINQSVNITIRVYRESDNLSMNASIEITGCGLNIIIDEQDAVEAGYWIDDGTYKLNISPKQAGTLSISVMNTTYHLNASRNFNIKGLNGNAWTSSGSDKTIILGNTEKLVFQIVYGHFADVHLTWVNAEWNDAKCINKTIGDNTENNGLNGIFKFIIDEDDFANGIGYIIIVGKAADYYVWDVIEIRAHKTFYVGGNEPGNYTRIQDAIDNTSDGDIVFVYDDSSPYYENIRINNSIHLIGENKDTTIIDGGGSGGIVKIFSDEVNISKFTIQNGEPTAGGSGIAVWSNYNSFYSNTIRNSFNGIFLVSSSNNSIVGNNFVNNIAIGIYSLYGSNNTILDNYVINNYAGIELDKSFENLIYRNNIEDNKVGFALDSSFSNIIDGNNFIHNSLNAIFIKSSTNIGTNNLWNQNYWGRRRSFPKPVLGFIEIDIGNGSLAISILWFEFDWHPAQAPYEIG
jgi:parallel beta-helix repeat protein